MAYRFEKTRRAKALAALREYTQELDAEFIIMVAAEIGLESCTIYSEADQTLELDLTDLQAVALAGALRACLELRNRD